MAAQNYEFHKFSLAITTPVSHLLRARAAWISLNDAFPLVSLLLLSERELKRRTNQAGVADKIETLISLYFFYKKKLNPFRRAFFKGKAEDVFVTQIREVMKWLSIAHLVPRLGGKSFHLNSDFIVSVVGGQGRFGPR